MHICDAVNSCGSSHAHVPHANAQAALTRSVATATDRVATANQTLEQALKDYGTGLLAETLCGTTPAHVHIAGA